MRNPLGTRTAYSPAPPRLASANSGTAESPPRPSSSTGSGFHGTDSNHIAREAGYSTGVFYKHFADKRDIFLAAYETWVVSEWKGFESELSLGGKPRRSRAGWWR